MRAPARKIRVSGDKIRRNAAFFQRPVNAETGAPRITANDVLPGANGAAEVTADGLAFRIDLRQHMIDDGFTKAGKLNGTHNLDSAIAALDSKGASYTVTPTTTGGISDIKYTYTNPTTGKLVSGNKTVYDPVVHSDQTILNFSQSAGQQAWTQYLSNPTLTPAPFDSVINGVNFRSYINFDSMGNPFIGNVHPIP